MPEPEPSSLRRRRSPSPEPRPEPEPEPMVLRRRRSSRPAALRRRRRRTGGALRRRRRVHRRRRRRRRTRKVSFLRRRRSSSSLIHSDTNMKKSRGVDETFDASVSNHVASVAAAGIERPFAGYINLEYVRLGCFKRSSDDKDPIGELRDKMCVSAKPERPHVPCRSYLPFYRSKVETDGAVDQCFSLCTQKGFDVFGLLDERTECRCGATAANVAVWGKWGTVAATRGVVWNYPKPMNESGDGKCHEVEVYRYTGWLEEPEADGVSRLLLRASLRDVKYIDHVVRGDAAPDTPRLGNIAAPANGRLAVLGKLWPPHPNYLAHGVQVEFAFMPELDQPGRHAFLQAAKVWSYYTFDCLTFKEVGASAARLEVSSAGKECGPEEPGYPGADKKRMLSLAGCGNVLHLHYVAQALGSVLGLAVDWEGQGGMNPESVKDVLKTYKCRAHSAKKASFAQTQQGSALLQEFANSSVAEEA